MEHELANAAPGTTETPPAPEHVPWYSLNPKHLRFSKFTWYLLAISGIIISTHLFSIKPLWQWGWRVGLYGNSNYMTVKSASGRSFKGDAWTHHKQILVYGAAGVSSSEVKEAADGLRSLVQELGLDFAVREVPPPDGAQETLDALLDKRDTATYIDMDAYLRRRLDQRGMRYGEIVIVDATFTDPEWAHGLTDNAAGIAMLRLEHTSPDLGRHEGAHLLGYDAHDDMPWYILGYREHWNPSERNTLMMLLPQESTALSERARDALRNRWQGLQAREGIRYFK